MSTKRINAYKAILNATNAGMSATKACKQYGIANPGSYYSWRKNNPTITAAPKGITSDILRFAKTDKPKTTQATSTNNYYIFITTPESLGSVFKNLQ